MKGLAPETVVKILIFVIAVAVVLLLFPKIIDLFFFFITALSKALWGWL